MSLRNIGVVYRKELIDTLRDRRTLISALLVPILITPVLILGFGSIAYWWATKTTRQTQKVMVIGADHAPELTRRLAKAKNDMGTENIQIVPPTSRDAYVAAINDKKLQAAVEIPEGLEQKLAARPDEPQTVKIYHYEGELRSRSVVNSLTKQVRGYSQEIVGERLKARGLSVELLTPFKAERKSVADAQRVTGNILGMMLPYMVIILCLTGAMYPAMDLTAGEKERGTMETILASPVNRTDLVLGKFMLVTTVSLMTTALSILSLALTAVAGITMLARAGNRIALEISVGAMAVVFFIVLPLAVLFSAALMAIAVAARNYKEAQGYIGPLMFVVILPAMGSFIPGVELNMKTAMVPIFNLSLVSREVLAGHYPWGPLSIILISTSIYAAAALAIAVWQFRREEVIFRT